MTAAAALARTCAIRRGPDGWERWDNAFDRWVPLHPSYAKASLDEAREYAAGFYRVRSWQVRIEAPAT